MLESCEDDAKRQRKHINPIEWDNIILYSQYVLDRAGPLTLFP